MGGTLAGTASPSSRTSAVGMKPGSRTGASCTK